MIACPDCGGRLVTYLWRNEWYTQHDLTEHGCRADFHAHGLTEAKSQDRFIRMCEQYGYTRALSEKIAALAEQIQAAPTRSNNE